MSIINIDHEARAVSLLADAEISFENDMSRGHTLQAQVEATLALVQAQREATEQARIANLIALANTAGALDYIAAESKYQASDDVVMEIRKGLGL